MTTVLPAVPGEAVEDIAAFGRFAAARGWVPATAGNFSRRLDARHVVVTRSGIDKGAIGPADVAVVALDGPLPSGLSAETPLHLERYRTDPAIGAVFHVHTVASTVLSRLDERAGVVRTEGFEIHKAFGLRTHESVVEIPVLPNDQDTERLARAVAARIGAEAPVPGFLLAGHGLYAWGATAADARRHVEGLEFLLACHLEERRLR
ncbi:MAG TPA: methylthioribulose 1-phosphate dehydratase [Candidatus Baltobacteraceae bacterium]|nr:methylthioribulose 1-phosphate dehydratase [Candidatus Baltobacteraceae bacterium]